MNILWDLVDPAELTQYARAYDDEVLRNRFRLDQLLPNRAVDDHEFRLRVGSFVDVDAAEYRAWDTQPAMTGRPGITRKRGELAPVSRQIPLLEEEGLRARDLLTGTNDARIAAIFDDVERMVRSVQARIELARGDVLTDGILTLTENGLQLTVDFGMPAGHKVTAPIAWTVANKATATPITDLLGWLDTYNTDTGGNPRGMIMSRSRLAGLLTNAEVRSYAAGAGGTPARVNLATLSDIFGEFGIPPIIGLGSDPLTAAPAGAGTDAAGLFFDEKVRVNGVQTSVIPATHVIFVPDTSDGAAGETLYGPTAEALLLRERGLIETNDIPGIVALALQNENPVQTFTLATAVALPVVGNANLLFSANVG
jgi:hypothetical protein